MVLVVALAASRYRSEVQGFQAVAMIIVCDAVAGVVSSNCYMLSVLCRGRGRATTDDSRYVTADERIAIYPNDEVIWAAAIPIKSV